MQRDIIHVEHNSDLSNNFIANELNSDTTDGEDDNYCYKGVHQSLDIAKDTTQGGNTPYVNSKAVTSKFNQSSTISLGKQFLNTRNLSRKTHDLNYSDQTNLLGTKNGYNAISMEDIRSNSTNQKSPQVISSNSNSDEKPQRQAKQVFASLPPKARSGSEQMRQPGNHEFQKKLHAPSGSIEGNSKISYKLMEKRLLYPEDFKLIEEAIFNLEATKPQSNRKARSTSLSSVMPRQAISQKQMIESLEVAIANSQTHSHDSEHYHIYRTLLKVHGKFEFEQAQQNKYGAFQVDQQIQILLNILNEEVRQTHNSILAQQTNERCLLQKGFLSLLDNLTSILKTPAVSVMNSPMNALQSNFGSIEHERNGEGPFAKETGEEVSFRISEPQRNGLVHMEESLHRDTLEQAANTLNGDPGLIESSASSPAERRLQRRMQKESSPVRAFLNNPRDEKFEDVMIEEPFQINELQAVSQTQSPANGSSIAPGEPIPEQIQVSRMFDKPDQLQRDQSRREESRETSVFSTGRQLPQPSIFSQQTQGTSKTLKSNENYKTLLKCMRIWKIYTKQEILQREQAKIARVKLERDIESEMELSKEMQSIEQKYEMAAIHYEARLRALCFQALIENIFDTQNYVRQVQEVMLRKKAKRVLMKCFTRWSLIIMKIKRQNARHRSFENHYNQKLCKLFLDTLRGQNQRKNRRLHVFRRKLDWKTAQKVFCQLVASLIDRKEENLDRSRRFYEEALKRKGLRRLRQMKQVNFREVFRVLESLRQRQVLAHWARITEENTETRRKIVSIQHKQGLANKQRIFLGWLDHSRQMDACKEVQRRKLKRRAFRALLKNLELSEKEHMVQGALRSHMEAVRLRSILRAWGKQTHEQQKYRSYQLHIHQKMDAFRLRLILKHWFNQIDILKRWRFLNQNTEAWYIRKTRKRVFRSWRNQIRLQKLFFIVHDEHDQVLQRKYFQHFIKAYNLSKAYTAVAGQKQLRAKREIVMGWIGLLNQFDLRKVRFKNKITRKVKDKHFGALKKYYLRKVAYRAGMKALLQRRAVNLMSTAYVRGLKRVWRQKIIDRNQYQAAVLYCKLSMLRRPFRALKRRQNCKRAVRVVGKNRFKHARAIVMKAWLRRYIQLDAGKRQFTRTQTKLKFAIFRELGRNLKEQVSIKYNLARFETRSRRALLLGAFDTLADYRAKRRAIRSRYEQIHDELYLPYLQKKSFRYLREYRAGRQFKREQKASLSNLAALQLVKKCFESLNYKVEMKRRERFMKKQSRHRLMFNCLAALNRASTNRLKVELSNTKHEMDQKSRVLSCFKRYNSYRKYFRKKEYDLTILLNRSTKAKCMKRLRAYKVQSQHDKRLTAIIHKKLCKKIVLEWREQLHEAIEEQEERAMALHLFAKHMFSKFKRASQIDKVKRRQKAALQGKVEAFYNYNSKKRALGKLLDNTQNKRIEHLKNDYAYKIQIKRVFQAWKGILGLLRRKRLLKESAELMRKNSLLEKCLQTLAHYAQTKIQNNLIIDRFMERQQLVTKSECLAALHDNIQAEVVKRNLFYNKIVFLAEKRLVTPLHQWKCFTQEQRMTDKAVKFFEKRGAQFVYRSVMDVLKVNRVRRQQKAMQNRAVDNWHGKILLQKTLLGLSMNSQRQQRLRNTENVIQALTYRNNLRRYFKALRATAGQVKGKAEINDRASRFYTQQAYKKGFIGLKLVGFEKKQVDKIREMVNARIQFEMMKLWRQKMREQKILKNCVNLLQVENDSRQLRSFFRNLATQTYHDQAIEHSQYQREMNIKQKFLDEVRKQILMKKIQESFQEKCEQNLKRNIIIELRLNAKSKIFHKSFAINHVDALEEESHFDLLQIAFNALKERVVLKKFKKIADNCFKLKTLRMYFMQLQQYDLQRKILKQKAEEVVRMTESKYMWHWRQAYLKEKEKNQAKEYLQSTVLYQVMNAWRRVASRQRQAVSFKANVIERNIMSRVLVAWKTDVDYRKNVQKLFKKQLQITNKSIRAEFFSAWMNQTHVSKVGNRMEKYYSTKTMARVFATWRNIKTRKNEKRLRIHLIRERLREKPELARPLKAMKNRLLFRAWNKLFAGSHLVQQEDENTDSAHYAYYFKLTRKTFLSLKLNAQIRFQDEKAAEIADLFLLKRWLGYMKIGIQYMKDRRKYRQKASIFRFLALQKRAMQALISHSVDKQEHNIKKEFAMKLYYKRLLDLGFAGLRAYKNHQLYERTEAKARTNSASAERNYYSGEAQITYQPQIIGNSNFGSVPRKDQNQAISQANTDLVFGENEFDGDYVRQPTVQSNTQTCQFREDEEADKYQIQFSPETREPTANFHPYSIGNSNEVDSPKGPWYNGISGDGGSAKKDDLKSTGNMITLGMGGIQQQYNYDSESAVVKSQGSNNQFQNRDIKSLNSYTANEQAIMHQDQEELAHAAFSFNNLGDSNQQ